MNGYKMKLQGLELIDITPRTSGILNLFTSSADGIYEVREHTCGVESYRLLSIGNYTDISLYIGPSTCIKVANTLEETINLTYKWEFGSGINALLVSSAVLYVFFLIIVGICLCTCCGFSGKIANYLYENKIGPLTDKYHTKRDRQRERTTTSSSEVESVKINTEEPSDVLRYSLKPLPLPPSYPYSQNPTIPVDDISFL